jgi:hypothetical protein
VALILSMAMIISCGGGGGSSNNSNSPALPTQTLLASNFNLAQNGSSTNIVQVFGVGDLNNDGLQDVVLSGFPEPANTKGSALVALKVYFQNLDGTLTDKTALIANNLIDGAMQIKIVDIDGDGFNDIFVGPGQDNQWAHMTIFWGGATNFTRQDFSDYGWMSSCIGDFNGDGKLDIYSGAVQNVSGSNNISDAIPTFYINSGSRTFTTSQATGVAVGGNSCATISVGSNIALYVSNQYGSNGLGDYIYTINHNMNVVGNPLNVETGNTIYSVWVTAMPSLYQTNLQDFVVIRDQNLGSVDGPGPKIIFKNNGDGTFSNLNASGIYTVNSGYGGDSVALTIGGQASAYFYGVDNNTSSDLGSIFQGLTQYRSSTSFSGWNWNTVYQNTVNGNIYILGMKNNNLYTAPLN